MKKIIAISIIFTCCAMLISCTNDEDEDKIEILTPTTDGAAEAELRPMADPMGNP